MRRSSQVDFEFFDLKPIDFHGLRALLVRYLDGELPFALSELVETLIEQVRAMLAPPRSMRLLSARWRTGQFGGNCGEGERRR